MPLFIPIYRIKTVFIILLTGLLFSSCQKEVDGSIDGGGSVVPVKQKPKVGTVWTYRYYTYYAFPAGGLATSEILQYKAKSEDVIAGEKWLNIVDTRNDSTAYLFQEKTDGLYRYVNNKSYLYCKSPAALNDTYTSYTNATGVGLAISSASEKVFMVKALHDTIPTGVGNIPTVYYEGMANSRLLVQLWYNEYVWIAREQAYSVTPFGLYYRFSSLYLDKIDY
jgi:hypothetical protein